MNRPITPHVVSRHGVRLAATLSIALAASLGAQAPMRVDTVSVMTSADRPSCDANGVDEATFNAILAKRLSALVSPATEGIPGSFLAIETKDAAASAAQTFNFGSASLTISVHGGFNEGVLAIFNDATLSPKFGGGIQLHRLSGARQAIQFDAATCAALDVAVRKAESALALRLAQIAANADDVQRRVDRAAYAEKERKIDSLLKAAEQTPAKSARDSLYRDSLKVEKAQVEVRRAWLDWVRVPKAGAARRAALNERAKAYQDARSLLDVQGFSFGWWSFGGSIDNTSFNLFDPQAELAAQISKGTFLARELSVTYSRIRQSTFDEDSWYFALAAKVGWEDNLSTLTKLDILDHKQYAAAPTERITEKKTTVYQGAYRAAIATIRIAGDFYNFFVPQNRLAVHVFPAFSAKDGESGEIALGGGLVLTAPNAAKKASIANAELFFNAPDLGNARHSKDNPWKRGALGLRLTFPINFVPGT